MPRMKVQSASAVNAQRWLLIKQNLFPKNRTCNTFLEAKRKFIIPLF